MLVFFRSLVFNLLFYVNLIVLLIAALPTLAMPRSGILFMVKLWGRTSLWLLRTVCGIRVEWRGREKIPSGGCIVASKHQSAWETFAIGPCLERPCYILKRELMWVPLFGWLARKADSVPVDRANRPQAIRAALAKARAELAADAQLVIFPEGTRRAVGAEPAYKQGVASLYAAGKAPCVPVALNSGLFWPRRTFLRYPGTIVMEFLEPIPPGLPPREFFARLQAVVEAATARLVAEGRRQRGLAAE